jgi:hypothetical protein
LLILLRRFIHHDEVKNMRRSVLSVSLAALVVLIWPATAFAATDPGLRTAGNFAVLSGTPNITNTGPTWISGQVGISPGCAVTGMTYSTPPGPGVSGPRHLCDAVALKAKTDLTGAYTRTANAPCPPTHNFNLVNLGGKTLVPGVYCQATAPTLTGTLTLNGAGVYIFQIGSTLITATGARVALIGGAQPCEVFWQVASSATLFPSTAFVGNIMALTDIHMQTRATLEGRALARNGAVTLDTNRIIQPGGCGYNAPAIGSPPAVVPGITPLPFSLGFSLSIPSNGVPLELRGQEFPWLLVIGLGAGAGAVAMGVIARRRRRIA